MNHATRTLIFILTLTLAFVVLACGGPEPDVETDTAVMVEPDAVPAPDEVAYEPAYPEDVSTEELTAGDTAQQRTHSHGGEEHTHDGPGDDHGHDH